MRKAQRGLFKRTPKGKRTLKGSAHYVKGKRRHYDVGKRKAFALYLKELDRRMKQPQAELFDA